jgi:hypothetical protein
MVEGGTSMEMWSCIRGWSHGLATVEENWLSLLQATSEGCCERWDAERGGVQMRRAAWGSAMPQVRLGGLTMRRAGPGVILCTLASVISITLRTKALLWNASGRQPHLMQVEKAKRLRKGFQVETGMHSAWGRAGGGIVPRGGGGGEF